MSEIYEYIERFNYCGQEVLLVRKKEKYVVIHNKRFFHNERYIECEELSLAYEKYYNICGRIANACVELERLERLELKDDLAQARLENLRLKMELEKLNKE